MQSFIDTHQNSIIGTISTFDRMIFKGHLRKLCYKQGLRNFLFSQRILLKNFKKEAVDVTGSLKKHAEEIAQQSGREFKYLNSPKTKATGESKEDLAKEAIRTYGITEGLVSVFSTQEMCYSFKIIYNKETHKLELKRYRTKCNHYYFYFIDPEFGFMHVRLQSWIPFQIQIYINGREWLARQLDKRGVGYVRYENCLVQIDDLDVAHMLCKKFKEMNWLPVLDEMARRVNPYLNIIEQAGHDWYYWVLDQSEFATDIMMKSRLAVEDLYPSMVETAMTCFGAKDVMHFLGRKPHGNFKGEVTTDLKVRPEGSRVKHRMKRNSVKMYDKASVLRVETTINNPNEFKAPKTKNPEKNEDKLEWGPMRKGVANCWRYADVSLQSNSRYLDAHAESKTQGKAVRELHNLCKPIKKKGKQFARFNPVSEKDSDLFKAVLAGEHAINGFRNGDLQKDLFDTEARSPKEKIRRSRFVTRLITKLRGHGLIQKVKKSRLYRLTKKGVRLMSAAVRYLHEVTKNISAAST